MHNILLDHKTEMILIKVYIYIWKIELFVTLKYDRKYQKICMR